MSLITFREYEEALRDWLGDRVEFFPDWRTADSAGGFDAHGFMHHWTAMRTTGPDAVPIDAQLMLLQRGRPGLDGPLSHLAPARNGKLWVTAGPTANANHAGAGDSAVYGEVLAGRFNGTTRPRRDTVDGNERLYGLEYMFHPDDGPMPDEQIEAGILGTAALAEAHGWEPVGAAGSNLDHHEWTTRKWDRDVYDLANRTRAGVLTAMQNPPHRITNTKEPDMTTPKKVWKREIPRTNKPAQEILRKVFRNGKSTRKMVEEIHDVIVKGQSPDPQ